MHVQLFDPALPLIKISGRYTQIGIHTHTIIICRRENIKEPVNEPGTS